MRSFYSNIAQPFFRVFSIRDVQNIWHVKCDDFTEFIGVSGWLSNVIRVYQQYLRAPRVAVPAVPGRQGSRSGSATSKKPETNNPEDLNRNWSSIKHGISLEFKWVNWISSIKGYVRDMSFFFFKKPKGYVGINSRKHWQKRLSARRLILCVLKGKLWLTRTPLSGAFRLGSDDIYLILYIYINIGRSGYKYI